MPSFMFMYFFFLSRGYHNSEISVHLGDRLTCFLSGVMGIHVTPPALYSCVSTQTTALSSVYQYKTGHFYRLVRLALNKECWGYSGLGFSLPIKIQINSL